MKPLYSATLAVAIAASTALPLRPAVATHLTSIDAPTGSHIVHSVAYPLNARVHSATYHIGLAVVDRSVIQVSIGIPASIKIRRGIEITDQTGKKLDATTSFNGSVTTIAFAQPISPGTTLELDMKGVTTSEAGHLGRAWLFPVSSRAVSQTTDIPLGTARIQTYQ